MESSIEEERDNIGKIDELIVSLLGERVKRVRVIGELKKAQGIPVRDYAQESKKMRRLFELSLGTAAPPSYIALVFRVIIEGSVRLQHGPVEDGNLTRSRRCVNCHWDTAGIIDPELNWPVCPVCKQPLL